MTAGNRAPRYRATPWAILTLLLAVGLNGLLDSQVLAQTRGADTFNLNMPSQRMDEALLTLALQTRHSSGT